MPPVGRSAALTVGCLIRRRDSYEPRWFFCLEANEQVAGLRLVFFSHVKEMYFAFCRLCGMKEFLVFSLNV